MVKDSIKKPKDLVDILHKCRTIVTFFHRSTVALDKLKSAQKQNNPTLKPLTLIRNVETRWNSQHDMLSCLLQVQYAINTVLCQRGMPDIITSSEWSRIEEYCDLLGLFKQATLLMTVEDSPTLCRYISSINYLRKSLSCQMNDTISNGGSQFRQDLLEELNDRFDFIDTSETMIIAMILDPRVKDRLLLAGAKDSAHTTLYSFANKYLEVSDVNVVSEERAPSSGTSGKCETMIRLCDTMFHVVCYIFCFYDKISVRELERFLCRYWEARAGESG